MKELLPFALLCALPLAPQLPAQSQSAAANNSPASAALATDPWEYGAFFSGGIGVGDRSNFTFANAGLHAGKVLTDPSLPGILRGQFEYAGELMPYWQSFTPRPNVHDAHVVFPDGSTGFLPEPYGGGTFTGVSLTPIILRWDLTPTRRFAPYLQGAGGLIWTNHKYPPDIIVSKGLAGGTSVWNFTPQFGIGTHYFLRNGRSIDFAANAIHISSASLGDRNPGVNASVQFQIGYTWWK